MDFHLLRFEELSGKDLYRILQLRAEVFIVEQECAYQDIDDKDFSSQHVLGYYNDEIHAYVRILPAGISYEGYAAIGRVVTSKEVRRKGMGRSLMKFAIQECLAIYPNTPIKISAQQYLIDFYSSLGFRSEGEGYLEDGIPHIAMAYVGIEGE